MATPTLALSLLLFACTEPAEPLTGLDADYARVVTDLAVADRDTARNVRNKEARSRKAEAERARVAFFKDPDVLAQIDAARGAPAEDPVRRLGDAWWRESLTARSWTEDEKAQETRLLGRLEEARSEVATWTSSDGEAEVGLDQAWMEASRAADALSEEERASLAQEYVSHRMAAAGSALQDLVKLRNQVARREGFANYWELALAAQGLRAKDVEDVVAQLTPVVQPVNAAFHQRMQLEAANAGVADSWANEPLLRRGAGIESGRDEADDWFDTDLAEERVMTSFQEMGLSTEGWQVHTGPRRYVRPGVYGFPIEPPSYVAIVMSQDRRWSVWQYEALAHEGGHAVWWGNLAGEAAARPVFWQPSPPWFEGFAQFFERQVYTETFTQRYVPELPKEDRAALASWRARHLAEWITDALVRTEVERRLYEDPANLEAVARHGAQVRSTLTGRPAAPSTEAGVPMSEDLLSPILWNYPAYSQNFLFAYLTEAALDEAVRKAVGEPVANPQVGPLLVEKLVQADPSIPFRDRLVELLGSEDLAATLRDDLQPIAVEPAPPAP